MADQAGNGAHLDTGRVHRHQEDRDARPAAFGPARLSQQEAGGGEPGIGGPDLLAVDHVILALTDRAGPERGKVGPGIGFREPLTPDRAPLGHRRDILRLLRVRAIFHQDRTDPVDVHVLRATRFAGAPHLLAQDEMFPWRPRGAAPFLGPVGDQQAFFRQLGTEIQAELGLFRRAGTMARNFIPIVGQFTIQKGTDARPIGRIFVGPGEIHFDTPPIIWDSSLLKAMQNMALRIPPVNRRMLDL